jgi:hypothetical protein
MRYFFRAPYLAPILEFRISDDWHIFCLRSAYTSFLFEFHTNV